MGDCGLTQKIMTTEWKLKNGFEHVYPKVLFKQALQSAFSLPNRYILSMGDAEDLQQYMLSLLDGSDPAVREFIPRLMERWYAMGGKPPPNATVWHL